MDQEHIISEQLFEEAKQEISRGNNWIAYNSIPYFLEKGDVYFFKHPDEAHEFSDNNISEFDNFVIIQADSIDSLERQIVYGVETSVPKQDNILSAGLLQEAELEIDRGNYWIAYDSNARMLDNKDMFFFTFEDEARTFAAEYSNTGANYTVFHAETIASLLNQLPTIDEQNSHLSFQNLEELFKSFDWTGTNYDPLQDSIEVSKESEVQDFIRMESLLMQWENLYDHKPELALELAVKYWEGHPMENYKNDFLTIKFDLMNEKNFDYLKSNIRNHGFGESLAPDLESALKAGQSDFTLAFKTEVNKREMEATLYFRRSNDTDMYFFNKYDTRLKNEKDETVSQTFYINNGWGVTLKEAYNLMNGRAVHKELTDKESQKYQAWIQLDFNSKDKNGNYERKQYHQNYGYDLKEALSYYAIKEMTREEDSKNLIRSLERGNIQQVTIQAGGTDTKVFIEANPQYKTINLYSSQMQRLDQEQRNEMMRTPDSVSHAGQSKEQSSSQDQSTSKENSQQSDKKKENEQVKDNPLSQEKGRKKSSGQAKGTDGLIEKKRTNGKKGMGI